MVRPWKLFLSVMMVEYSLPFLSSDHFRAALMAHSFASAPELPKKTFYIPVFSHSSCASFAQGSV